MNILSTPHPILITPTKEVLAIDKKIHKLVAGMTKTLAAQKDPEGVGLAAPQIGVGVRVFIMKKDETAPVRTFINPKIVARVARAKINKVASASRPARASAPKGKLEGCLSIPLVWGRAKRDSKVQLTYTDLSGKTTTSWFSGFEAMIIQHEVDHLDGILFTKRVLEAGGKLYKEKEGELKEYKI